MRLDNIDLNLFVVFDAIYRERNITRVAGTLSLTQPAVSNALKRLRSSFNDPLFVRMPGGVAPTPVADAMAADVRRALELLGDSVGAGARFDPLSADKTFHLAISDLAETLLLPRLRRATEKLAPGISLTSYYSDRDAATAQLRAGQLDLLLDAPVVRARELVQQPLGESRYVLAMRKGHPLGRRRTLNLEDYLSGEHLHVSSRPRGRGQVDMALYRLGHQRHIAMRVQNYLVAARVAAETDLLWTVPFSLAQTLSLTLRELPFAPEPLGWSLFWPRAADDDPANAWLRSLVRQEVAQIRLDGAV
ncbi:MAG: LysR family transcriptional regulator [Pseudomonadota bacterium]